MKLKFMEMRFAEAIQQNYLIMINVLMLGMV
jgi:hypothetical protein